MMMMIKPVEVDLIKRTSARKMYSHLLIVQTKKRLTQTTAIHLYATMQFHIFDGNSTQF